MGRVLPMNREVIGQRIRDIRESKNYTRERLASLANITPKCLYEIEVGRKGFSIEVLDNLAKALSVSSDYILFGTDDVKNYKKIQGILEQFTNEQMDTLLQIMQLIRHMCD